MVSTQLNICGDTTVDWNNYMREIWVLNLKSHNVKMWRKQHENQFIGILNCMSEHFPLRVNY